MTIKDKEYRLYQNSSEAIKPKNMMSNSRNTAWGGARKGGRRRTRLKAAAELDRGTQPRAGEHPRSSLPLILSKCPREWYKPLVSFQSSDKVNCNNLGQFPHWF